jgi:hypothetical protein
VTQITPACNGSFAARFEQNRCARVCFAARTQDNIGKNQFLGLFPAPVMLKSSKFSITARFCLPGLLREPGCSGVCVPGAARCSIELVAAKE